MMLKEKKSLRAPVVIVLVLVKLALPSGLTEACGLRAKKLILLMQLLFDPFLYGHANLVASRVQADKPRHKNASGGNLTE